MYGNGVQYIFSVVVNLIGMLSGRKSMANQWRISITN